MDKKNNMKQAMYEMFGVGVRVGRKRPNSVGRKRPIVAA